MRLPERTGTWGRRVAWGTAYGGATSVVAGALGWGLLKVESRMARKTIGTPTTTPPVARGFFGERAGPPLRLAVIGDSSAAGFGVPDPQDTPGAKLAAGVARGLQRPVDLDVVAVVGARSAGLDVQVGRALRTHLDLAVVLVGANDVTHRTDVGQAARDLARAVRTLRAAGVVVVVGTCPDLGSVRPLWQPLRAYARLTSRRLAAAQAVAVAEAGGVAVSLGDLLAREFWESPHLWSADRFHPSAAGYQRLVDVLLPTLLRARAEALGQPPQPVDGVPDALRDTVQDVAVAAAVAAREPGSVLQAVPGDSGAASDGPGRLVRLRRLLPYGETGVTAPPRAPEG